MELYAANVEGFVAKCHDPVFVGAGGDAEFIREALLPDPPRMIEAAGKRGWDASKKRIAGIRDYYSSGLSVVHAVQIKQLSSEIHPDGLEPQADAEDAFGGFEPVEDLPHHITWPRNIRSRRENDFMKMLHSMQIHRIIFTHFKILFCTFAQDIYQVPGK